jgi:hypothetical protein
VSDESSNLGWILAGVSTVIATLTGVIAKLFQRRESESAKAIAKLESEVATTRAASEKCEQDRVTLFANCKVMELKINMLEQRVESINKAGTEFSHNQLKING